ncbi:hypothetical protein HDU77_008311 [Chytriomyces hyalinus]|nr:hypothetical protein HDU77_008311 [Chytriomyces hyalinus]
MTLESKRPHRPRNLNAAITAVGLTAGLSLLFLSLNSESRMRPGSLTDECPRHISPPSLANSIYVETRPRLFNELSKSLDASPHILLVPSAPRPLHAESDSEYSGWKQTANVKYLLDDYPIGGGLVALTRCLENCTDPYSLSIYLPVQTEREDVFMGAFPSAADLIKQYRVSNVYAVTQLAEHLAPFAKAGVLSTVPTPVLFESLPTHVTQEIVDGGVNVQYSADAVQSFHRARFVKTELELERLIFASRLAGWVHAGVAEYIYKSKSVSENDLYTEFVRLSSLCGGDLQAYPPIVGAGPNGAVLHYRTGASHASAHAKIQPNTFVLIDAAPEYAGYTSDLTRTYVRGGKGSGKGMFECSHHAGKRNGWTREMKEVYGIVERVQQRFIDAYALGADWSALNSDFFSNFTSELIQARFIVGVTLQEAIDLRAASVFMPHGLGHPVGLEVHDPTPTVFLAGSSAKSIKLLGNQTLGLAATAEYWSWAKTQKPQLYNSELASYQVFKGHIATVEPGIYFIPKLLESVRKDSRGDCINWAKIDGGNYVALGGVRIEDVVMFGHDGVKRVITRE